MSLNSLSRSSSVSTTRLQLPWQLWQAWRGVASSWSQSFWRMRFRHEFVTIVRVTMLPLSRIRDNRPLSAKTPLRSYLSTVTVTVKCYCQLLLSTATLLTVTFNCYCQLLLLKELLLSTVNCNSFNCYFQLLLSTFTVKRAVTVNQLLLLKEQ